MNPFAQGDRRPAAGLPGWLHLQAAGQARGVALRHKRLGVWQERTWSEVLVEVGGLAGALSERGFRPGSTLTILSNPRPEALLLALAAQWLGGCAAVLEPRGEPGAPDLLARTPGRDFVFAEGLAEVERVRRAGLAPTLLVYADPRGLGADPARVSYPALAASTGGHVPALLARPAAVAFVFLRRGSGEEVEFQQTSHVDLLREGLALVNGEALTHREEAFAARAFAASGQARYLLAPWLIAGFCLNFPEGLETRDIDRRELGPTLVAGTRETWLRLESLVHERLPVAGTWQRRLVDRALAPRASGLTRLLGGWLVRRPLRDVLGFTRTRVPLIIGEPLPEDSAQFFAALGIAVRNWTEAADWKAHDRALRPAAAPDAAPSGFERQGPSSLPGVQPV
ncbi:MAG: long-chain fatty acid--CoA ligase [Zoogloea sp.]|nr:long-chain fatty acid--CoA ligase [Zoogloea sp.]